MFIYVLSICQKKFIFFSRRLISKKEKKREKKEEEKSELFFLFVNVSNNQFFEHICADGYAKAKNLH